MLIAKHLRFVKNKQALLDIDHIKFSSGQFHSIVGPNGAGKSTLLKALIGDIGAAQSVRELHHISLINAPKLNTARQLAYLPQHTQLSFSFSAREVVELGFTPHAISRTQRDQIADDIMQACDCLHLKSKRYPKLSGGEQQRVNLARALVQLCQANEQGCLLLDEAFSAQDLGQQNYLLGMLGELAREKNLTVIAVLHDLNQVLNYCDNALLIDNGKLVDFGHPKEVITRENLSKSWNYSAEFSQTKSGRMVVV